MKFAILLLNFIPIGTPKVTSIDSVVSVLVCWIGVLLYAGLLASTTRTIAAAMGFNPRVLPPLLSTVCYLGPWTILVSPYISRKTWHHSLSIPQFLCWVWLTLHLLGHLFSLFHWISDALYVALTLVGLSLLLFMSKRTAGYLAPRVLVIWRDLGRFESQLVDH